MLSGEPEAKEYLQKQETVNFHPGLFKIFSYLQLIEGGKREKALCYTENLWSETVNLKRLRS